MGFRCKEVYDIINSDTRHEAHYLECAHDTADTYLEKQNCVKMVLFQLPPLSHSLQKSS